MKIEDYFRNRGTSHHLLSPSERMRKARVSTGLILIFKTEDEVIYTFSLSVQEYAVLYEGNALMARATICPTATVIRNGGDKPDILINEISLVLTD